MVLGFMSTIKTNVPTTNTNVCSITGTHVDNCSHFNFVKDRNTNMIIICFTVVWGEGVGRRGWGGEGVGGIRERRWWEGKNKEKEL